MSLGETKMTKTFQHGIELMHEVVRQGAQLFLVLVASATIHALEDLNKQPHREEYDNG